MATLNLSSEQLGGPATRTKIPRQVSNRIKRKLYPVKERKKTTLKDGDRVEIVAPMEGG